MIDATGKIGLDGGLFEGNVVAFGNYEECINIRAEEDDFSLFNYTTVTQPRFQGQYVLTQIVIVEDGDPDQKLMKSGRPRHLDYGSDFGTNSSLQRDFLLVTLHSFKYDIIMVKMISFDRLSFLESHNLEYAYLPHAILRALN